MHTPPEQSLDGPSPLPAVGSVIALLLLVLLGGALSRRESVPRGLPTVETTRPDELISSRSYGYREHAEPDRTVSSIEFRLEARGENTAEMVIEAAAVGPLVQPPRGFRYRAGENPITAREIAELEADQRLSVVTKERGEAFEQVGEIRLGEMHQFSERKIALDGTLKSVNGRELPSSLRMGSGALTDGDYELAIYLDGAPRLQVEFRLEDGARKGTIGEVRALHPENEELAP